MHELREKSIVTAIIKRLRQIPGCVVRKRHGTSFGIGGDPDLFGCINGRHFEIEVKRPGEHPTPLQTVRLQEWRAAGAVVGTVHSVDEAVTLLTNLKECRHEPGKQVHSQFQHR